MNFFKDISELIAYIATVLTIVGAGLTILAITRSQKDKERFDNQINKISKLVYSPELEIVNLPEPTENDIIPSSHTTELPELIENQNQAIHKIQKELRKLRSEISQKKNTWSLVEGLVENYHKQALRQASIQFWFSALAAIVGLLFIVISLSLSESLTVYEKIIGTLPGVTIDLLAALFFKQAEQTRQRATELYDRLRLDNEREESIKLIETIDEPLLKSIVKAQLALKIGGVDASLSDLSSILRNEQQKTT